MEVEEGAFGRLTGEELVCWCAGKQGKSGVGASSPAHVELFLDPRLGGKPWKLSRVSPQRNRELRKRMIRFGLISSRQSFSVVWGRFVRFFVAFARVAISSHTSVEAAHTRASYAPYSSQSMEGAHFVCLTAGVECDGKYGCSAVAGENGCVGCCNCFYLSTPINQTGEFFFVLLCGPTGQNRRNTWTVVLFANLRCGRK